MRLVPTALGIKGALFFATVTVLFLATPYSNLFFLLTAFLAVLGAVGVFGAWSNLRAVDVLAVRVEPCGADAPQPAQVRLVVPGGRRSYGLEVALVLDGVAEPVAATPMAQGDCVLPGVLSARGRGLRRVTAVQLRSRHPFGICRSERLLPVADVEVVTHPRPARFGQGGDGDDPRLEDGWRQVAAPRESVAGLREWRAGDSLREVHWRATARRGKPIVKEHETDVDLGLDVVIDRRCQPDALERALSTATRLLLDADALQQPLRLRSQDCDRRHGADGAGLADTLRWLAAAQPLPADAPPPPVTSPQVLRLPAPQEVHA
ncbi:MAG: DUF58 domain-containing protein [Planctomycetota bacterium]